MCLGSLFLILSCIDRYVVFATNSSISEFITELLISFPHEKGPCPETIIPGQV